MTLINIGSKKQLFVDNYLVESLKNARQVMNPAQKVEDNPVLLPDRPWEGNSLSLARVLYDPQTGQFRMWYSTTSNYAVRLENGEIDYFPKDDELQAVSHLCLATSTDGIHWDKPDLGRVEFQGSKHNNILPPGHMIGKLYGFFEDEREPDPAKRYKGMLREGTVEKAGMQWYLYFSPDLEHWTPYAHNPVVDTYPRVGRWGPTDFMGWDPIRQVYAAHMENCLHRNSPLNRRLIGRAESPDMIHWSEPETIIIPDEQDPPDLEFYAMPTFVYEGLYVGLLWNFRTLTCNHHPELVFSRDGIHYERRYREPFIPRGAKGDFDNASVYAVQPFVHGDRIFTYYNGVNHRSVEVLLELGKKALGTIGLATTPLDGFVSVDGPKNEYGELVTRSFSFTGRELVINMRSHLIDFGPRLCDLRVELLAPDHELIPGYTFQACDPILDSDAAHVVSWQGKTDLSAFAGQAIKLRFYIKNARLYAFWFK
jgi:hypothetical protein